MRIKQNKLKEPDFVTERHGIKAEFYSEPMFCMNVIKGNEKQCYPISADTYTANLPETYATLMTKHDICITKAIQFNHDVNLKAFYKNAADEYKRRAYAMEVTL